MGMQTDYYNAALRDIARDQPHKKEYSKINSSLGIAT